MLTACEVIEGSEDARDVERLLTAAFPAYELVPYSFLTEQARRDEVSLLAYHDDGQFCGFVFMIEGVDMAYVLYLAVDETLRSKGYGARILADVSERCAGKTLMLDIEPIDEAAPNLEQRKRRREFYLRNGFEPTGYTVCFEDDVYEALCKGPGFDPERFCSLINELPEGEDKRVLPLTSVVSPFSGKPFVS